MGGSIELVGEVIGFYPHPSGAGGKQVVAVKLTNPNMGSPIQVGDVVCVKSSSRHTRGNPAVVVQSIGRGRGGAFVQLQEANHGDSVGIAGLFVDYEESRFMSLQEACRRENCPRVGDFVWRRR